MRLFEIYREDSNSTFTHDGKKYDINLLFKLADHLEPEQYRVSDMTWVLKYDPTAPSTFDNIDINIPLLITMWFDELVGAWRHVVIDGLHRLKKAQVNRVSHLYCKMIPSDMLAQCLI